MVEINTSSDKAAPFELKETNTIPLKRLRYYRTKRLIDFSLSLFLIIILFPIYIIIAALIFIYSPGPIFFTQTRVGARLKKNSHGLYWETYTFPCYKFRTMKENADPAIHKKYVQALILDDKEAMAEIQEENTNTNKLQHDSRIIKPGFILRKLSLDELPQFINVLIGDMSLVGPRPAIPYEVEVYKPWHQKRLQAQPGISGLQQITARCTKSFDEQVKIDLEYIQAQCFTLDLKIILQTPLAILSTRGAL